MLREQSARNKRPPRPNPSYPESNFESFEMVPPGFQRNPPRSRISRRQELSNTLHYLYRVVSNPGPE